MKVLIVEGNRQYSKMYEDNGFTVTDRIKEADLVQFTGGADVYPGLYDHDVHPRTLFDWARDVKEQHVYEQCLSRGIPMIGICRGAQFLNVMCGGSMYQHVDGHAIGQEHLMVDVLTGEMISVTSTHHQMMNPSEKALVVAVASESTFKETCRDGVHRVQSERGEDVEVVWYESQRVLCYQPHPEYRDKEHDCQRYFFDLIKTFVGE